MSSLEVFLALFLVALGLCVFFIKKKFSYWKERGFDYIEPEFPFGNLKGVGYKIHFSELSREYYERYKNKTSAIGLYFFTQPVVFLTNLDAVKNILVKDFYNFHDRGLYVNTKSDPLSAHLFAIEGAEWKRMRTKLSPTFTSMRMKTMFGTVLNISEEMINYLSENNGIREIEMKDILARFTTDVIGSVAFGIQISSMRDPKSIFRKMGSRVFNPPRSQTLKIIFLTTFRKWARKFSFRVIEKEVADFFLSTIEENINYREKNNIQRNDFFNLLLELKNLGKLKDDISEAGEKLTFNEIAAQSFLFYLAGFETSSTTMTFALYELSLNINVQEKLRNEIKSVLEKHENKITYDAMMEMKYLQMVIDETLRMYPPVDNLIRIAKDDYQIPDTKLKIEKDTLLFIPVLAIQHDSNIYENPEKFDPERFNDEMKAERHPMAFLPFGQGNRNCIGERFGYMQTKIGLIQLILNFKFSPSANTTIPMKFQAKSQILSPINDMWLNIEKIQN
ncbi:hypothetical protein PVAND_000051 [Polypedilum vanderplanki]|uniref:Cytochrome P450 n=1 Tax=Polypedilum vanderplanki TaxID=319348 RepID=A0A9J6BIW3_POLVA|nr:hypothetical protein PVAND_000051 [Polypedilum vanderplanki]